MPLKNQYFGDVNDYRKYGLLRLLTRPGELSIAVCWMLTPDDGRTDGRFTEYLGQRERWRHYDPALFCRLLVVRQGLRNVTLAEQAGILPLACYYPEVLHDDRESRSVYFEGFWTKARGCDLIFFDPDNGLEVNSTPCGCKESSKYLYWGELAEAFRRGCSVLVYQHFRREKRDAFIEHMATEIARQTKATHICSLRTANVVFFLLAAQRHMAIFEQGTQRIAETWGNEIICRWFEKAGLESSGEGG